MSYDAKRRSRGRDDDGDEPRARGAATSRRAPNGAVEPIPRLRALHGETVFQAGLRDGGDRCARIREVPFLCSTIRSHRSAVRRRSGVPPGGPAKRDVALTGSVLALSDPRAGRLVLVQGGSEIFGPATIDVLDLASATVAASRPLEDLSAQPRVYYDEAGQVVHQVASRALTVVRHGIQLKALQAAQLDDGGHAVLAFVVDPLPAQGYAIGRPVPRSKYPA